MTAQGDGEVTAVIHAAHCGKHDCGGECDPGRNAGAMGDVIRELRELHSLDDGSGDIYRWARTTQLITDVARLTDRVLELERQESRRVGAACALRACGDACLEPGCECECHGGHAREVCGCRCPKAMGDVCNGECHEERAVPGTACRHCLRPVEPCIDRWPDHHSCTGWMHSYGFHLCPPPNHTKAEPQEDA